MNVVIKYVDPIEMIGNVTANAFDNNYASYNFI